MSRDIPPNNNILILSDGLVLSKISNCGHFQKKLTLNAKLNLYRLSFQIYMMFNLFSSYFVYDVFYSGCFSRPWVCDELHPCFRNKECREVSCKLGSTRFFIPDPPRNKIPYLSS